MVLSCLLGKSEIAGSNHTLALKFQRNNMFLPHSLIKIQYCWSLRDREVRDSASDCQGSNFGSCGWSAVSFHSSHHLQEVFLAQFSIYVHKGGLTPMHFIYINDAVCIFSYEIQNGKSQLSSWANRRDKSVRLVDLTPNVA